MALPDSSLAHYRTQQRTAVATTAAVTALWGRMGDDFDPAWARIRPQVVGVVQQGMTVAATTSATFVAASLAERGIADEPHGVINPAAFASTAPDGRRLDTLLDEAVIKAKTAVAGGVAITDALRRGQHFLRSVALTAVADSGRAVVAVDIAQRATIGGYTRMLNPPSCSRCVILAGKWFRWNEGFQRHPRCDCRHIPSAEDTGGDFRTDPYEYFRSLDPAEQERVFGRSEARAIREGADIYRVVNIQNRGLATAKGNLRFGTPSRMTVDDIFRTAGTRTNAVRMLEAEGYITGPQVRGGNILGRFREGYGQLGKGGRARAASDAVTAARQSNVRDPLNRYTMTAAERRLFDAKYRLDAALTTGRVPRSIGANSADLDPRGDIVTDTRLATLRRDYALQVQRARGGPPSVQRLARALGIRL